MPRCARRGAHRAFTRLRRCASFAGNREVGLRLRDGAAVRSRQMPPFGCSSALASAPAFTFRFTTTCCGTAAATPWPTRGMIPARLRIGSGVGRSSTPCAMPLSLHGSRTFGAEQVCEVKRLLGPDERGRYCQPPSAALRVLLGARNDIREPQRNPLRQFVAARLCGCIVFG
jgi:hypothetical protein